MKRHHVPALLVIGLITTCAAITLRNAYEEGRECRTRGGVIIEREAEDDLVASARDCTADY